MRADFLARGYPLVATAMALALTAGGVSFSAPAQSSSASLGAKSARLAKRNPEAEARAAAALDEFRLGGARSYGQAGQYPGWIAPPGPWRWWASGNERVEARPMVRRQDGGGPRGARMDVHTRAPRSGLGAYPDGLGECSPTPAPKRAS